MSGDVQPRKRKDKKRKKDELEEPRGTAAALGEGDVFMHASHDHGTGGHWCAKIIFFSLLAVLITLIGLIILENRGLSELEANSVESRYSGVLEGWIEDAPDDDHHDVHTLELKHHDDDEDDHDVGGEHDDEHEEEDEHDTDELGSEDGHDDEDDEDQDDVDQDDEDQDDDDQNLDTAEDEDEDEGHSYSKYFGGDDEDETEHDDEEDDDQENENDDEQENEDENQDEKDNISNELDDQNDDRNGNNDDDDDENQSIEKYDENDDENDEENDDAHDDEDEGHEHDDDDDDDEDTEEIEVERIEREASEEEDPISLELPALPEADEDDDGSQAGKDEDNESAAEEDEDDDFLEADDDEPPVVERIIAPAGKPFIEVEEEESSEKPPDTLEEEEEYEQKQEQLRREKEQASHMWLKLIVGGALLVATHAVVRRATAPRDVPDASERVAREETPIIDRRMTLIPEEPSEPVMPKKVQESSKPFVEESAKKFPSIAKSAPVVIKQESEEEEEQDDIEEVEEKKQDKESYSDEEDAEDDEEEIIKEKKELPKQFASKPPASKPPPPKPTAPIPTAPKPTASKPTAPVAKKQSPEPEPDEEVPDDVEIIDDEQLEEEMGEEDDEEEEISDVDDAELLTRLEAKYGRLPEPERPGQRHKDGGNSIEDEWPGEPSEAYWRQQLDSIERELRQGAWLAAAERAGAAELGGSARARYLAATALDRAAEAQRDNRLLTRAIAAYLHLLKMNERLSDKKLLEIANRTLDRIQFRGTYLSAEPVYRILIRRFPNDPTHRNNLSVSFLMANRADLAEEVLKETLQRWPHDRVALAHYGFVLKNQHNRYEEAVEAFRKALDGDKGPACEPRYYYHLGDALLLLGRYPEAHEVHKRAASLGFFLSPAQRSLYNVPRLKSRPWWNVDTTPYAKLARALENSWRDILKEGEAARAMYEKEKEGLKERGEWSQLDLFARGQEIPGRCARAPVTCAAVRAEPAAVGCRRGQVKFSAMEPGTHVRPHVGPTNCRLRMHLGLSNTKDTYLRVDQETRQWQEGKVLMFDDSFEHEVWHNGTGKRLVLIVDVWHPDLTPQERQQLTAI